MLDSLATLQVVFYGAIIIVAGCWVWVTASIINHYLLKRG